MGSGGVHGSGMCECGLLGASLRSAGVCGSPAMVSVLGKQKSWETFRRAHRNSKSGG